MLTRGRSRRLPAGVAGAGPRHLPRLRRLQQPGDLARRHRAGDAAQPGRRLRPRQDGREQPRGAAPADRSDQGRQGRRLPVCRRSEVHADSDGRPAVEELCRDAPQADRAAQGDGLSVGRRAGAVLRRRRPALPRCLPRAAAGTAHSPTTTKPSATRRASRSSTSTATRSPARRRSAAASAPASSSATPACC